MLIIIIISVIAVGELWTSIENETLFDTSGCSYIVRSHMHKVGGGLRLELSNSYNYSLLDELLSNDVDRVESIFVVVQFCCDHFNFFLCNFSQLSSKFIISRVVASQADDRKRIAEPVCELLPTRLFLVAANFFPYN